MSCLWLKMKTPYRFTSADIAEIARTMRKVKRNDSPAVVFFRGFGALAIAPGVALAAPSLLTR